MLLVPVDDAAGKDGSHYSFKPWKSNDRPVDVDCGILNETQLQNGADRFVYSGVQVVTTGDEVLSVIQGEVAVAQTGDGPLALGSDSATTCHIVGFRNPASGRTCLAHLDSPRQLQEAIDCMLRRVSGGAARHSGPLPTAEVDPLDLYIVGGYLGESVAQDLSNGLLSYLHASPRVFRVVLACMSRINSRCVAAVRRRQEEAASCNPNGCDTQASGVTGGSSESGFDEGIGVTGGRSPQAGLQERTASAMGMATDAEKCTDGEEGCGKWSTSWLPRRTGLAIDLASGRPFSVRFEGVGRGPGWEVRHARLFTAPEEAALAEIYDPLSDSIVLDPFPIQVHAASIRRLLELPDQELLDLTSTSPDAEEERFVADIKSVYSYVLARAGINGEKWLINVFGKGRGTPLVFPRVAAN